MPATPSGPRRRRRCCRTAEGSGLPISCFLNDALPGLSDASFRKQEIGEAALRSAVRQHRRRRHEPQPAHVIVNSLGVAGIVAVIGGDAGEQILEILARHQIAVGQGRAAEIGQQGIARTVDMDLMATWHLHCVEHVGFPLVYWTRFSRRCGPCRQSTYMGHHFRWGHNIHVLLRPSHSVPEGDNRAGEGPPSGLSPAL